MARAKKFTPDWRGFTMRIGSKPLLVSRRRLKPAFCLECGEALVYTTEQRKRHSDYRFDSKTGAPLSETNTWHLLACSKAGTAHLHYADLEDTL